MPSRQKTDLAYSTAPLPRMGLNLHNFNHVDKCTVYTSSTTQHIKDSAAFAALQKRHTSNTKRQRQ